MGMGGGGVGPPNFNNYQANLNPPAQSSNQLNNLGQNQNLGGIAQNAPYLPYVPSAPQVRPQAETRQIVKDDDNESDYNVALIKIKDKNTKKSKTYSLSVHKDNKGTAFLTEFNLNQTTLKSYQMKKYEVKAETHDFLASFLDIELDAGANEKITRVN